MALLAATSSGAAYVWTQVPAEPGGEPEPVATNVWFGQVAFQVSGEPGTRSITCRVRTTISCVAVNMHCGVLGWRWVDVHAAHNSIWWR